MRRLVLLFALSLAAPLAVARPPSGPYEPFQINTDNVPQAEIAGWLLPANGRALPADRGVPQAPPDRQVIEAANKATRTGKAVRVKGRGVASSGVLLPSPA